jgi:hypothetical protein
VKSAIPPLDEQRARQTTGLYNNPRQPTYIAPDPEEHRAAEQTYWKRQVCWQAVGAIATILAFGAAAVYAHYAKQQVAQTQRLVVRAHDQVVEASNANKIAKEAVNRADFRAKEANQIARDAFVSGERPWIGLDTINIDQPLSPTALAD